MEKYCLYFCLSVIDTDQGICREKLNPDVCNSAIWNVKVRQEVKVNKPTDQHVNSQRAANLLPGTMIICKPIHTAKCKMLAQSLFAL